MALGSTFDFVNRSRQNRELMKANRNRRARMREMYAESVGRHQSLYAGSADGQQPVYADGKIPAEELARIKNDIRQKMRKEARDRIVWAAAISLAVVVAGFFLVRMLV